MEMEDMEIQQALGEQVKKCDWNFRGGVGLGEVA